MSSWVRRLIGKAGLQNSFFMHKGYEKLLVTSGSMSGVDTIPMQVEYENALKGNADLNRNIIKLGKFNELAYDLILSINTDYSTGR